MILATLIRQPGHVVSVPISTHFEIFRHNRNNLIPIEQAIFRIFPNYIRSVVKVSRFLEQFT